MPSENGALPASVRVKLGLDFLVNNGGWNVANIGYGVVNVGYQDQSIRLEGPFDYQGWDINTNNWQEHFAEMGLDDVEVSRTEDFNGDGINVKGTVSFDLLLDEEGVSDPLNLSLSTSPHVWIMSNFGYTTQLAATLSLLDLTLPDGTPLHEAGYSVTFDSGLAWPQPVPEPAPIALLGAGMALAGWKRWRNRAGA